MSEGLGERLQEVVSAKKLLNKDLANIMGIKSQTLTSYIRGQAAPKPPALVQLHRKLGIDINWLLTGRGDMLASDAAAAPRPELTSTADTLRRLMTDSLDVGPEELAEAAGLTVEQVEAMLERRAEIPATAIRSWVSRYRINANFLVAQIGQPLLSREEFLQQGPMTWLRMRDGEHEYPANMESPDNPPVNESLDETRTPIAKAVADIERAMGDTEELDKLRAIRSVIDNRIQSRSADLGIYNARAGERRASLHEDTVSYPEDRDG